MLLVEDLTTDGGSKNQVLWKLFVEPGAEVQHTIVVFYYDIFPETKATMKKLDLTLHYLATWWDVLQVCTETNAFDRQTLNEAAF